MICQETFVRLEHEQEQYSEVTAELRCGITRF